MDVATIKMPKHKARERFNEYAEALKTREPTPEDTAAMQGYKALADGKDVLDLFAVFRNSEGDAERRPRLAIGRAHWKFVAVGRTEEGSAIFQETKRLGESIYIHSKSAWHRRIRLPSGTLHNSARPGGGGGRENLHAIVPTIPPTIRPPRALHRYVILWEAEWKRVPPVDPLLLRQLAGGLYVILASWDLTELERAVLGGRA